MSKPMVGIDLGGTNSPKHEVNIGINQPLLKRTASIGLSAKKLFKSMQFTYHTSDINFNKDYHIKAEGPLFMLNFSYLFNNYKHKKRGMEEDASVGGGMF